MKLNQLYALFAHHPESQWIMQYQNAIELYKFIKEHDVKRVLGLGTGIGLSDVVMALAFKDKGVEEYKIDSIEQYEKCVKLANQIIPEELKKNINIIKSEVIVWKDERMPYDYYSIYKDPHFLYEDKGKGSKLAYDLIINDGPAPFMEGEKYIDLPNGTIHKMLIENELAPGTKIIYDGRIQSLKLLERYFSDNLFITYVSPRNSDFNVLERKDNELIFKDDKLEMMKIQTSYFKAHDEKSPISSHQQSPSSSPAAAS